MLTWSPTQQRDYEALAGDAAAFAPGARTWLRLAGRDRAAFLHGFCTNDIKRLRPGGGCEAFVTDVRGRVMGHVFVFCREDSLVIETVPGQAQRLLDHLDRYRIREDVVGEDETWRGATWFFAGPRAAERLASCLGVAAPSEIYAHVSASSGDSQLTICRVPLGRVACYLVHAEPAATGPWHGLLTECTVAAEVFEAARVEAGFPFYGQDITGDNLPQEVNRDAQAISFTKGCYLGQETVARIDALGHVNRRLVCLVWRRTQRLDADPLLGPAAGPGERITTAVWSPRYGAPLALAYVHRSRAAVGSRWDSPAGPVEVVDPEAADRE